MAAPVRLWLIAWSHLPKTFLNYLHRIACKVSSYPAVAITAVSGKGGRGGGRGRGRGGGGGGGLLGLVNANREMIFVFLGIFGGLGVLFCMCYCKYLK